MKPHLVRAPEVPPRRIEIQPQPPRRRRTVRNVLLAATALAASILWQTSFRWTETSVGTEYAFTAFVGLFTLLVVLLFVAERRRPAPGVLTLNSEFVHWKLPPNVDVWISYDELRTATLAREDGADVLLLRGGGKTISLETAWFPKTDDAASVLEDVLARSR